MVDCHQIAESCNGVLGVGIPWEGILEAVEATHADLVIMGTHARGTHARRGVTHALLGSVAEEIVRMSPVPVLTVRAR